MLRPIVSYVRRLLLLLFRKCAVVVGTGAAHTRLMISRIVVVHHYYMGGRRGICGLLLNYFATRRCSCLMIVRATSLMVMMDNILVCLEVTVLLDLC